MRKELTSETFNEFNKRFDIFHDALIKSIIYDFATSPYPGSVQIIIDTWDWNEHPAKNRLTLFIELEGVRTILLRKLPPETITVVGMLDVHFSENEVTLDFFPGGVPYSFLGYKETMKIKGPIFVVSAQKCFWKVEEKGNR